MKNVAPSLGGTSHVRRTTSGRTVALLNKTTCQANCVLDRRLVLTGSVLAPDFHVIAYTKFYNQKERLDCSSAQLEPVHN